MKIWKLTAVAIGTFTAIQLCHADAYHHDHDDHYDGLYRANELSIDLFGTGSVGEGSIRHWSGDRLEDNSRLGAGAGLNYFFTRQLGIGVDAYTESTSHFFVDSLAANFIARFPVGDTFFAPYVFGGAGHQFERREQWFGDVGGGMEFRFTPHFGIFVDARYVLADKTDNYGVGRAGLRFVF